MLFALVLVLEVFDVLRGLIIHDIVFHLRASLDKVVELPFCMHQIVFCHLTLS